MFWEKRRAAHVRDPPGLLSGYFWVSRIEMRRF